MAVKNLRNGSRFKSSMARHNRTEQLTEGGFTCKNVKMLERIDSYLKIYPISNETYSKSIFLKTKL